MAIGGQKNYGLTDNLVSTVLNVVDKNNQRVDRLDEISARTKTSYIKKAGADLASRHGEIRKQQKQHKSKYGVTPIHPVYKNASTVAGDDDSPWSEKQKRKLRNRITGIKRASENIERVDSNVEESSSSVSESKAKKDKKSFFAGFIMGGLAGAGTMLLFAPQFVYCCLFV